MKLLVDIGNSRIKWGWEETGLVRSGTAFDYRQFSLSRQLGMLWQGLKPNRLVLASVASDEILAEVRALAIGLWPEVEILTARTGAVAGLNAYRQPEKLGVDRWLAILAAHHDYPGACCIADCGTAITVDVLDSEGRHLGGIISPGLMSMKKALAADAAALEFTSQALPLGLADNTAAAIETGTLLAAVGLIETIMRRQQPSCRLILCGGDAELIARQLQQAYIVDTALVLKGLNIYYNMETA